MPEISRFYGMVITMYFDDHPPPHFHVRYADARATICIATGELLSGALSPRAASLLAEWTRLHSVELEQNWTELARGGRVSPIEPLA
ncbi:MAG: DUF4160 domain-containing protein [Steroidobacteraceae bacterium]